MSELIENRYPRRQEDISEIDRLRAENERLRDALCAVQLAISLDRMDEQVARLVDAALESTNEKGNG